MWIFIVQYMYLLFENQMFLLLFMRNQGRDICFSGTYRLINKLAIANLGFFTIG